MRTRFLSCIAAGWLCVAAASPAAAGEPLAYGYYGDYGRRFFGAAAYVGAHAPSYAPATVHAVGYPHGYPYGRTWHFRPWYASPCRYQSYYYRPWYGYRSYYPRNFGLYHPRAYGYFDYGHGDYGRDPWPYDFSSPFGAAPAHGCELPADDLRADYGGCYYW